MNRIVIEVDQLFDDVAKLSKLDFYIKKCLQFAGEGNEVIVTGAAPVWLYLKIAHALHGKAKKLIYKSPIIDELIIFDHDPF